MITSIANQKVKKIVKWRNKAKERNQDKVFLAEGFKMYEEAPNNRIQEVYVSQDFLEKAEKKENLRKKLKETGYEIVTSEVFEKMSDTQTPQGILMVLQQPKYYFEELLKEKNPLFLILEDLQDPGNLGTIIRTGEAAGVTGILLAGETVDIFNPKTVRATMGAIYRVPFVYVPEIQTAIQNLHDRKVHTYAAHLQGEKIYYQTSFRESTAFLIGNEGNGLKKSTADMAQEYLKIPMEGKIESLNAAVAASLLMYEAYKQRNEKKDF